MYAGRMAVATIVRSKDAIPSDTSTRVLLGSAGSAVPVEPGGAGTRVPEARVARLLGSSCAMGASGAWGLWVCCVAPAHSTNPAVRAVPTKGRLQREVELNAEKSRRTQDNQVDGQSGGPRGLGATHALGGVDAPALLCMQL